MDEITVGEGRMNQNIQIGPVQTQSTPSSVPAQTAPVLPDYAAERDSGHVWSALGGLKEKTGELSASIAALDKHVNDLKRDFKDLDGSINELKTEQVSTAKTIKLLGWIATPLISLAAFFGPKYWNDAMRPELEKAISATVKAEIDKELAAKEHTKSLQNEIADLKSQLKAKSK